MSSTRSFRTTSFPEKKRVLIVDDHPIVRDGLARLINGESDLSVVGEAEDVTTALHLVDSSHPDIVVVDISLKDSNGIDLIKSIAAKGGSMRTLVWSMFDEEVYAERALRAGAMGYLNKREASERIVAAIRCVLSGDLYVSERLSRRLARRSVGKHSENANSPLDALTNRELEVFELIGEGLSPFKISQKLQLAETTVTTYRDRIRSKLGLSNSTDLTRFAMRWVLQERDDSWKKRTTHDEGDAARDAGPG